MSRVHQTIVRAITSRIELELCKASKISLKDFHVHVRSMSSLPGWNKISEYDTENIHGMRAKSVSRDMLDRAEKKSDDGSSKKIIAGAIAFLSAFFAVQIVGDRSGGEFSNHHPGHKADGAVTGSTGDDGQKSTLVEMDARSFLRKIYEKAKASVAQVSQIVDFGAMEMPKIRSIVSDEYRREVFFAYENRLREHSNVDKVFAYFASEKNSKGETMMTKEDLIRSAIPVYQKTSIRSGSLEGEVVKDDDVEGKDVGHRRSFIGGERIAAYFDTNNDGMINFPEFVFFTTLMKLSDEQILQEFVRADVDGNGELDAEEFAQMMRRMRNSGNLRQDVLKARTGVSIESSNLDVLGNGIFKHFFVKKKSRFSEIRSLFSSSSSLNNKNNNNNNNNNNGNREIDRNRKITLREFREFLNVISETLIDMEFSHYDENNNGWISSRDLGYALITRANSQKTHQYLELVKKLPDTNEICSRAQFREFMRILRRSNKFELLIHKQHNSEVARLNFVELLRQCSTKSINFEIMDAMTDVLFRIFDADANGSISVDELNEMRRLVSR